MTKESRKETLREFVEETHNLLSVLSILGGLTAFFVQVNSYLALTSFAALFLLSLIVWRAFPRSDKSSRRTGTHVVDSFRCYEHAEAPPNLVPLAKTLLPDLVRVKICPETLSVDRIPAIDY